MMRCFSILNDVVLVDLFMLWCICCNLSMLIWSTKWWYELVNVYSEWLKLLSNFAFFYSRCAVLLHTAKNWLQQFSLEHLGWDFIFFAGVAGRGKTCLGRCSGISLHCGCQQRENPYRWVCVNMVLTVKGPLPLFGHLDSHHYHYW